MQKRPVRHPETAYRSVGDDGGLVVMPLRSEVKVLNPVGTRIYSLLDGKHTLDEIVAAVVDEFEVSEPQARDDVQEFLRELSEQGLVSEDPEAVEGAKP